MNRLAKDSAGEMRQAPRIDDAAFGAASEVTPKFRSSASKPLR
jgi:hypothetical protein